MAPSPAAFPVAHKLAMTDGAFALLDCLGFKGIWNGNTDAAEIIEFMNRTKIESEQWPVFSLWRSNFRDKLRLSIAFVSDTVAISAAPASDFEVEPWAQGLLVQVVSHLCLEVIKRFATMGPKPLLCRGCIVYGKHLVHESFFLGPAVDEAAELFETSQGAFVWLTPSATALYERALDELPGQLRRLFQNLAADQELAMASKLVEGLAVHSQLDRAYIEPIVSWWIELRTELRTKIAAIVIRNANDVWRRDDVIGGYPMELKTGGVLRTSLLNPFYQARPHDHADLAKRMLSSFDRRTLDVMVKEQNTARYFERGLAATQAADRAIRTRLEDIQKEMYRLIGTSFQIPLP